jgi:hypothetical protein
MDGVLISGDFVLRNKYKSFSFEAALECVLTCLLQVLQITSAYKQGIWDIVFLYHRASSAPDRGCQFSCIILPLGVQEVSG